MGRRAPVARTGAARRAIRVHEGVCPWRRRAARQRHRRLRGPFGRRQIGRWLPGRSTNRAVEGRQRHQGPRRGIVPAGRGLGGVRRGIIKVPVGALFRQGEGWAVFVVEEGRVRRQTVQLGQRNENVGQITGGLEAGATIVLHPPDTLMDGARVTVKQG